MARFHMKQFSLRILALALLLLVAANAAAATRNDCNQLIYKSGSHLIQKWGRFRNSKQEFDIDPYSSLCALSPDRKRIAFVGIGIKPKKGEYVKQLVVLIDRQGKLLSDINLHLKSKYFSILDWVNDSLLRVTGDMRRIPGKRPLFVFTSHFIRVSRGGASLALLSKLPKSEGLECAPSPSLSQVACIGDAARRNIKLFPGGGILYSAFPPDTHDLSSGPAWSPDGKRIAVIENSIEGGQRWLILLKSAPGGGVVEGRELLPITEWINRVDFTSNTHIRATSEKQVFDQDIPASGKLPHNAPYKLSPVP